MRLLGQQQPVHTLHAVLEMQTDVKEEWYGEARGKPVLARPASKPDLREEECCHQKRGFWAVRPAVIIRPTGLHVTKEWPKAYGASPRISSRGEENQSPQSKFKKRKRIKLVSLCKVT